MAQTRQVRNIGTFPQGMRQWRDTGVGLAMLPALTLMVFIRRQVGYRKLSLGVLVFMTFLLYLLNGVANFHVAIPLVGVFGSPTETESLRDFGFAFLGVGLWERHKRWKELKAGARWHTFSHGVSYLEFLPVRTDFVYRFVDGGAALLAGLCLNKLGFTWLGLWIAFSAICLCIVEAHVHEKQLEADLETLDSLLEAEMQGATVAHFEGKEQASAKARSITETHGVPTGADAELEAVIARRRQQANTNVNGSIQGGVQ